MIEEHNKFYNYEVKTHIPQTYSEVILKKAPVTLKKITDTFFYVDIGHIAKSHPWPPGKQHL